MIARHVKLKTNRRTKADLDKLLWHLTGCYNWAIKTIALRKDAGLPYSEFDIFNLLSGHSKKSGVSIKALLGTVHQAFQSWERCWAKQNKKPHLKGNRNKLNSICYRGDVKICADQNTIKIPGFPKLRYHRHTKGLPKGKIAAQVTVIKKASGWYAVLLFDRNHEQVVLATNSAIGIDTGFKNLITTSNGEVFEHPQELRKSAAQLARVQRGGSKKRAARLHEKICNQRKDRNHKISHAVVRDNKEIYVTNDNLRGQARRFGKSVQGAAVAQLRNFIIYKGSNCGRKVELVDSRYTTMSCSACEARTGPTGLRNLNIRNWECLACGAKHDRDVNAAINVLKSGQRYCLEEAKRVLKTAKPLKKLGRKTKSCAGRATT